MQGATAKRVIGPLTLTPFLLVCAYLYVCVCVSVYACGYMYICMYRQGTHAYSIYVLYEQVTRRFMHTLCVFVNICHDMHSLYIYA